MTNARPRKRLSAGERRAVILDAAERVFAGAGYDGVSMDEIARAGGVTKPVLYDHFASKLEVFGAVLDRVKEHLLARGTEAKLSGSGDAERVRAAVSGFFLFTETNPTAMRVLLVVPSGSTEAQQASLVVQKAATAGIAGLISDLPTGQDSAGLEAIAEYVKAGLHALAWWWLNHPAVSRQDIIELGFRLVWSGLGGLREVTGDNAWSHQGA